MLDRDALDQAVRMVCTFINPKMAHDVFIPKESVESDGFLEDLKKLNPNFDPEKYEDVLDDTE